MSMELLRRTACYLCDADLAGAEAMAAASSDPEFEATAFSVLVCPACGLGHLDPYPSPGSLQELYEETKSAAETTVGRRDFDRITRSPIDRAKDLLARRQLLRRVEAGVEPRLIVDYGTGNGRYAMTAARLWPGARVLGVDYQETPPPLSEGVEYTTVDAFMAGDEKADLIILRYVLEHSPDPVALLRSLAAHLSPTGSLLLEVPNLASGLRKVAGPRWIDFYPPEHIFHYDRRSLPAITERAGLRGVIGRNNMPLLGTQIAGWLGIRSYPLPLRVLGALAYPVQLAIEGLSGASGYLWMRLGPVPPGGEGA